ncbi:hypothetical protein V1477_008371 [Vespula maculifrons]|uniref:Uncharacterized protein n=1 Tax=Vespula maculifrons TaxID=7453 RepID=A0ABD2CCU5_VESMC
MSFSVGRCPCNNGQRDQIESWNTDLMPITGMDRSERTTVRASKRRSESSLASDKLQQMSRRDPEAAKARPRARPKEQDQDQDQETKVSTMVTAAATAVAPPPSPTAAAAAAAAATVAASSTGNSGSPPTPLRD